MAIQLKKVNGETPDSRLKRMDDAVTQAQTGTKQSDFFAFLSKPRSPEQKKNLQVQLNDAGVTSKTNTNRQKLRLRKIRSKK